MQEWTWSSWSSWSGTSRRSLVYVYDRAGDDVCWKRQRSLGFDSIRCAAKGQTPDSLCPVVLTCTEVWIFSGMNPLGSNGRSTKARPFLSARTAVACLQGKRVWVYACTADSVKKPCSQSSPPWYMQKFRKKERSFSAAPPQRSLVPQGSEGTKALRTDVAHVQIFLWGCLSDFFSFSHSPCWIYFGVGK